MQWPAALARQKLVNQCLNKNCHQIGLTVGSIDTRQIEFHNWLFTRYFSRLVQASSIVGNLLQTASNLITHNLPRTRLHVLTMCVCGWSTVISKPEKKTQTEYRITRNPTLWYETPVVHQFVENGFFAADDVTNGAQCASFFNSYIGFKWFKSQRAQHKLQSW